MCLVSLAHNAWLTSPLIHHSLTEDVRPTGKWFAAAAKFAKIRPFSHLNITNLNTTTSDVGRGEHVHALFLLEVAVVYRRVRVFY